MAATLAVALRTAFLVLGFAFAATVIYTIVTDGLPFRRDVFTPWVVATLIDLYINVLPIGAWIVYRESNFILSLIWIVLLVSFRSIASCAYIFLRFLELSTQESQHDSIYFVLARRKKKDEAEPKGLLSVQSARILFILLGLFMLGTLIYTTSTDGSPFRQDVLTPWMSATLVDFYVIVFALSVWVAYKESNWITATLWILFPDLPRKRLHMRLHRGATLPPEPSRPFIPCPVSQGQQVSEFTETMLSEAELVVLLVCNCAADQGSKWI